MTDQTTEDRYAFYWLQAERRFEAQYMQHEPARQSMLKIAKASDTLAKSLNVPDPRLNDSLTSFPLEQSK